MRTYLLLLVAVAAVPLALVAGFLVTTSWLKERAALERGVLDTTRALTLGVDQQLETSIASLQVLAGSDDLTSGNLRAFYRDAAGALRAHPDWDNLLVIDAAGERQLVNLRRPYGAPLPAVARPDAVQPALGSRRPFVSDLHEGRLSQGPLISITVPVVREGVVRYALSANVRPQTFGRLLARQKFETGWICSIVDGEHRFIASSRGPHVIGEPASETLRQKRTELDEGGYRSVTIEGVRSYSALKHSALSRWVVAMATPAAPKPQRQPLSVARPIPERKFRKRGSWARKPQISGAIRAPRFTPM